jgi:hypothetical protein
VANLATPESEASAVAPPAAAYPTLVPLGPHLSPLSARAHACCHPRLLSFVAAAKQQHTFSANHRVIHSIAQSPINPQLEQPCRNDLPSPKFPAASRLIRVAIFACARASASCVNQSSKTSFPARLT